MTFKVFVSHSEVDGGEAEALKTILVKDPGMSYQVWLFKHEQFGGDLWPEIVSAITDADFMILLESETSAASANVASEYAYAEALLLPVLIIPIGSLNRPAARNVALQNKERGRPRHSFVGVDAATRESILLDVRTFTEEGQRHGVIRREQEEESTFNGADELSARHAHKDFRRLRQHLQRATWAAVPQFARGLISYESGRALRSAEKIISPRNQSEWRPYTCDVSHEASFLGVAAAFFRQAREVYFVSIEGISSFWIDGAEELRRKYMESQYPDIFRGRLFVFHSRDGLNDHRNVLNQQLEHYGTGKVLVTSLSDYLSHSGNLICPNQRESTGFGSQVLASFDFALAKYGNQWCLAVLTPDTFFHVPIENEYAGRLQVRVSAMEVLMKDPERFCCLPWAGAATAAKLEGSLRHDQDVLHLVRLQWGNVGLDQIYSDFDDLKNWLQDQMSNNESPFALKRFTLWHGLDTVDDGKMQWEPTDSLTDGKIQIDPTVNCVMLALIFDNRSKLYDAYKSKEFANKRAELLHKLLRSHESEVLDDAKKDIDLRHLTPLLGVYEHSLLSDLSPQHKPFFREMYQLCESKLVKMQWLRREDYTLRAEKYRKRSTHQLEELLNPVPTGPSR